MTGYLVDWLSLLGRWVHLITGIAWIGASFYFVWLDNHLLPPADEALRAKGVGGELWSVHGGGFYNSQKYRVAPQTLPSSLHWFYWEAYGTLLSGLFLLALLYYAQADIYLIDARVAALSRPVAIAIGAGAIVAGWLVYDALCRSALNARGAWLGAAIAGFLCLAAYGLCHVFSGRGAFIEFGAMLGTIMVANVFFVIIPGQRALVRALREGRDPGPQAGIRGKLRSVHNTYFTLPVLFTMLSNHYAMIFSARGNWLVLTALCAAGALIRVFFVHRHKNYERGGKTAPWPMLLGLLLIAVTAAALAPRRPASGAAVPTFTEIQRIVAARCAPCHAAVPAQPGFAAAPAGILLDSPDEIMTHVTVMEPPVAGRLMPVGNLTGMTDLERKQLLDWLHHGAPR